MLASRCLKACLTLSFCFLSMEFIREASGQLAEPLPPTLRRRTCAPAASGGSARLSGCVNSLRVWLQACFGITLATQLPSFSALCRQRQASWRLCVCFRGNSRPTLEERVDIISGGRQGGAALPEPIFPARTSSQFRPQEDGRFQGAA